MNQSAQLAMDFSRGRRNEQSQKAHAKLLVPKLRTIVPKKASMQDKVFALIEMAGDRGLTVYEVSDALKVPVHSISGRISELSFAGKVVSGDTRQNSFGNECTIWRKAGI